MRIRVLDSKGGRGGRSLDAPPKRGLRCVPLVWIDVRDDPRRSTNPAPHHPAGEAGATSRPEHLTSSQVQSDSLRPAQADSTLLPRCSDWTGTRDRLRSRSSISTMSVLSWGRRLQTGSWRVARSRYGSLIDRFEERPLTPKRLHGRVLCGYAATDVEGERVPQLESYGSDDRAQPGSVSKVIQLDEARARDLVRIIERAFPR